MKTVSQAEFLALLEAEDAEYLGVLSYGNKTYAHLRAVVVDVDAKRTIYRAEVQG